MTKAATQDTLRDFVAERKRVPLRAPEHVALDFGQQLELPRWGADPESGFDQETRLRRLGHEA